MLIELDKIPEGLLDARPNELVELLGGPTLIHLQGQIESPLFVVVLQHGNEVTGFKAVQQILKNTKPDDYLVLYQCLSVMFMLPKKMFAGWISRLILTVFGQDTNMANVRKRK